MVSLGDVGKAPIVTAGFDGAVLLLHNVQRWCPWAGGLLTEALLFHVPEALLGCLQSVEGESPEAGIDRRTRRGDEVLHMVLGGCLSGLQLELEDVPEEVLQEGVVIGSGGDGGTC